MFRSVGSLNSWLWVPGAFCIAWALWSCLSATKKHTISCDAAPLIMASNTADAAGIAGLLTSLVRPVLLPPACASLRCVRFPNNITAETHEHHLVIFWVFDCRRKPSTRSGPKLPSQHMPQLATEDCTVNLKRNSRHILPCPSPADGFGSLRILPRLLQPSPRCQTQG